MFFSMIAPQSRWAWEYHPQCLINREYYAVISALSMQSYEQIVNMPAEISCAISHNIISCLIFYPTINITLYYIKTVSRIMNKLFNSINMLSLFFSGINNPNSYNSRVFTIHNTSLLFASRTSSPYPMIFFKWTCLCNALSTKISKRDIGLLLSSSLMKVATFKVSG